MKKVDSRKKTPVFAFPWERYRGGYTAMDGQTEDGDLIDRALVENIPNLEAVSRNELYHPLQEHTGLFRAFAEVDPTERGVVLFANRFGLLGVRTDYRVFDADEPFDFGGRAEPLAFWIREITAMKQLVACWDAIRVKKSQVSARRLQNAVLGVTIEMAGEDSVPAESLPPLTRMVDPPPGGLNDLEREGEQRFVTAAKGSDLRELGREQIDAVLRDRLKRYTSIWTARAPGKPSHLVLRPQNLLGALWLQFAQAVSGNVQHRQCSFDSCGTWFEVSTGPDGAKALRLYCSNACKQKRWRRDKAKQKKPTRHSRSTKVVQFSSR